MIRLRTSLRERWPKVVVRQTCAHAILEPASQLATFVTHELHRTQLHSLLNLVLLSYISFNRWDLYCSLLVQQNTVGVLSVQVHLGLSIHLKGYW